MVKEVLVQIMCAELMEAPLIHVFWLIANRFARKKFEDNNLEWI